MLCIPLESSYHNQDQDSFTKFQLIGIGRPVAEKQLSRQNNKYKLICI